MRNALLAVVFAFAAVPARAYSEPTPVMVRGETIVIEGDAPPYVPPKPVKNYRRIAPPYSDYAILHDVSTRAWLLLDIDSSGRVNRIKLLKRPGADLDQIAIKRALQLRFEPATNALGQPIRAQMLWTIEWPSYWWMVSLEGLATRIPSDHLARLPCRDSGRPLHMDSVHPVYRDCSLPELLKIASEPWILPGR